METSWEPQLRSKLGHSVSCVACVFDSCSKWHPGEEMQGCLNVSMLRRVWKYIFFPNSTSNPSDPYTANIVPAFCMNSETHPRYIALFSSAFSGSHVFKVYIHWSHWFRRLISMDHKSRTLSCKILQQSRLLPCCILQVSVSLYDLIIHDMVATQTSIPPRLPCHGRKGSHALEHQRLSFLEVFGLSDHYEQINYVFCYPWNLKNERKCSASRTKEHNNYIKFHEIDSMLLHIYHDGSRECHHSTPAMTFDRYIPSTCGGIFFRKGAWEKVNWRTFKGKWERSLNGLSKENRGKK